MKNYLRHLRHIDEHYYSNLCEWYFEGVPEDEITWWMKLRTLLGVLRERFTSIVCEYRGHDWESIHASAEHGTEELMCKRCGMGHHVQW